jgi:hypothetical protein
MSEDYRMNIFDVVSLALAYFDLELKNEGRVNGPANIPAERSFSGPKILIARIFFAVD